MVEEDVAFDPVGVGLLGAVGVVFGAEGVADLFHEFSCLRGLGGGCFLSHCGFSVGVLK